ncbi:CAMK4 (predicted) [Pycnogonum litorale]
MPIGQALRKFSDPNDHQYWFKESTKHRPFLNYYEKLEELGRGATSVVHKCRHKLTGKGEAVKIIQKNIEQKIIRTEIGVLLKLNHRNVIKLKEVFETPTEIYLVLELVTGGELFERIVERGYYTEKDASDALRQILEGLAYLQENDVVHRDLKPENLLYEDEDEHSKLKIADFGLSKIMGHDALMQTICGTPSYCAPEVLLNKGYDKEVDMWSAGVIAYILVCGFEPFYDERGDQEMFKRIVKGDYEFVSPWWDDVSLIAKDLISNMLVVDPKERLTARQALEHPWVTGDQAKTEHMQKTVNNIKEFNARRKLRAATHVVLVTQRVLSAMSLENRSKSDTHLKLKKKTQKK